ncbi:unnamed protein product [Parnassius mnemosyne]|uniref:NadR/Ttd14 AAA domain-containing protein n=1 Tax=Parnassius mnemosyne TaxID=213953 RepID=A0AAV1KD31_9NEOP
MEAKRFIALEGLACTFKTTLLKRFAATNKKVTVHLSDFAEVIQELDLQNKKTAPLIYTAARVAEMAKCSAGVHIFDRVAITSVLYTHIFNEDDDDARHDSILADCASLKKSGLMADWGRTLIMLTKPGQEDELVENMRKRGNGLDWLSVEYVRRQNQVFKIFAEQFGLPVYELDLAKSWTDQQDEIVKFLWDMCLE